MEILAIELGYGVGSLPTTYLGPPPLGDPHKLVGVSNSIEDRFRKRLTSRKRQYISKGGRLTLIWSTLSSLPIYFLYLFQMPNSVCSRLENIQRDFIWGSENLDQKPHLINLKTMCSEKKKGVQG